MTTTASFSSPAAPLSRLARLGSGFGFKQQPQAGPSQSSRQYTDANDSEWYIPYNGPYEQPKEVVMGRAGDRDNWTDLVGGEHAYDPFERDRSALGHGGASTSGHGHGRGSSAQGHTFDTYYGEERERGRPFSPASKYSDSLYGGGERRSQAVTSPVTNSHSPRRGTRSGPTFLNLDTSGVGIGESPVPAQRVGHSSLSGHSHDYHERSQSHSSAHHPPAFAPAVSPRDSAGSFWTFGRSSNKKSPPIQAFGGRPSIERRSSATIRQSAAQTSMATRERSATVAGQSGEPPMAQLLRPRSNTALPPGPAASSPVLVPSTSQYQYTDEPLEADRAISPYERHPYAMASAPIGHRQHSRLMQSDAPKQDAQPRRTPTLNLPVPFLSSSKSFASLRKSTKNLKASVSTPNLRGDQSSLHVGQANGGSSAGSRSPPSSGGSKWLSAETWCDALLFPRPRFRMRAAHIISPPTSPLAGAPPFSAPPQTQAQPRSLKRSLLGGRNPVDVRKAMQAPLSAPPELSTASTGQPPPPPPPVAQPEAGPSHRTLRPPRPKSFAQDDLALPSPVPSLATVIKQNEAFDKERDEWKSKASRSFANKRSRSLSRSRIKGKAKLTAESQSELVSSFDLIAASAFHGNQTLKPSIHFAQSPTVSGSRSGGGTNTTSTGLNTSSSHSRNTSNVSHGNAGTSHNHDHGHGHSRKESWSKSALKTAKHTANATGLCGFADDLSPADEKVMELDNSPGRDRTKVLTMNGREKEDINAGGVVIIAPHALKPKSSNLGATQQHAPGLILTPVPSNQSGESTSHSGVGIALSTPTALVDQPFQFSDHPFANGTRQNDVMPRSADYAGPHPSRMAEFELNESSLNDVSMRHRMPAAVSHSRTGSSSLHPYAVVESQSRPSIRLPTGNIPSPSKMFAETATGAIREILPDEIQYSPYSSMYPGSSKRNSALGVEEALSMAFSHGSMDNTEFEEQVEPQKTEEEEDDFGYESGVQELVAPPVIRSGNHYLARLMPQIDEVSVRESWQTSQDENNLGSFEAPTPLFYKASASPGQRSLDSSPMTSPRQFKKFDDMEDYSDLFYRPGQQVSAGGNGSGNASASSDRRTPTSDLVRALSRDGSSGPERPMLSRSNSALTNLRRQLSEEYGAGVDERRILEGDIGLSRHVSEVSEMDEDINDAHAIFSQGSSPPGTILPLRVPMNRPESSGPAHLIPEDVESSRASSILERFETEDGTEIYYRLGEVPALSTPDPVTSSNVHRASAHGSYIEDTPRGQNRYHQSLSPVDHGPSGRDSQSRPSLKPPTSATTNSTTRASYMTSTSSASRISQLSDFPAPPGQNALTPGTIIQSYFGSTPEATEHADPMAAKSDSPEQRREDRQSRRTTFGPVPFDSSDHS